jgi:hypothetical protein
MPEGYPEPEAFGAILDAMVEDGKLVACVLGNGCIKYLPADEADMHWLDGAQYMRMQSRVLSSLFSGYLVPSSASLVG